jgi:hypothetical protein
VHPVSSNINISLSGCRDGGMREALKFIFSTELTADTRGGRGEKIVKY